MIAGTTTATGSTSSTTLPTQTSTLPTGTSTAPSVRYATVYRAYNPTGATTTPYTSTSVTATASPSVNGTLVVFSPLATLDCARYAYLVQQTTLSNLDLASGTVSSSLQISANGSSQIDAIGYNSVESYIYGNTRGTSPEQVYRIGGAGQTMVVVNLPLGYDYYAGDVDGNGQYWLAAPSSGGGFYWTVINLNQNRQSYG